MITRLCTFGIFQWSVELIQLVHLSTHAIDWPLSTTPKTSTTSTTSDFNWIYQVRIACERLVHIRCKRLSVGSRNAATVTPPQNREQHYYCKLYNNERMYQCGFGSVSCVRGFEPVSLRTCHCTREIVPAYVQHNNMTH